MFKRKYYLILLVIMSVMFVSCSEDNSDKVNEITNTIEQQSSTKRESSEETSSVEETTDNSIAEKTTTKEATMEQTTAEESTTQKKVSNQAFYGDIVELTDAELSLDNISTGEITENTEARKINIEYPVINSDSEDYKEVNALIKKCVEDANGYYCNLVLSEMQVSCTYEVIYYTDKYISIVFDAMFSSIEFAHPTSYCYGVTIDLENAKVVSLVDMGLELTNIEKRAQDGEYTVESGGFFLMSDDEKLETIGYVLDDVQSDYKGAFYRDAEGIYMVIDGISHAIGDYSIIRFAD